MRENRTCGSEGGEAQSLPYPYPVLCKRLRCWVERRRARALRASTMPGGKAGRPYRTPVVLPCMHERRLLVGMLINFTPIFSLTQSSQPARKPARPALCERLLCRLESRRSCAHDGVLSARWKSVRGFYLDPEIEANCVVARRGGEQAKMNYWTAG